VGNLLCPAQLPGAPRALAADDLIGINSNVYEGNLFTASGCGWVASSGSDVTFKDNIMVDDGTQNPAGAVQLYVDNMEVSGNVLVGVSMITRGNSGIRITDNILCRGEINAPGSDQGGNRFTCDGLPRLDIAPLADLADKALDTLGDASAALPKPKRKLPSPRNLRIVVLP
jgi:hypothetical protein